MYTSGTTNSVQELNFYRSDSFVTTVKVENSSSFLDRRVYPALGALYLARANRRTSEGVSEGVSETTIPLLDIV
jgi:hypothetical protein